MDDPLPMDDPLVPHGWDFKRLFAALIDPHSETGWPTAAESIIRLLKTQTIASLASKSEVSARQLQNYSRDAIPSTLRLDVLVDALDCFNHNLNLHRDYAKWSNAMQSLLRAQADAERAAIYREAARKRKTKLKSKKDAHALASSVPHATTTAALAADVPPTATYDPTPELDQTTLNALPLDVEWIIDRATYGEGAQLRTINGDDLVILPTDTTLFCPTTGRPRSMASFAPSTREACEALDDIRKLFFPRVFRVYGRKRDPAWTVRVHVCTDIPYGQGVDASGGSRFECECFLGLGGIAAFIDERGDVRPRSASEPAAGLGCAGIVVAVAYERGRPVCKSRYMLVVRKGIRYPEDVMFSVNGRPFASTPENIPKSRFFFQSREAKGNSTDIFVADYNGQYLCNLNEADPPAWEGFTDQAGREIARWTEDGESVLFCSSLGGNGLAEVIVRADAFPRSRRE